MIAETAQQWMPKVAEIVGWSVIGGVAITVVVAGVGFLQERFLWTKDREALSPTVLSPEMKKYLDESVAKYLDARLRG